MFDLDSINNRSHNLQRKPYEMPRDYRKRLRAQLEPSGLGDFTESFIERLETIAGIYKARKDDHLISPSEIRQTHGAALQALNEANGALQKLYRLGVPPEQEIRRQQAQLRQLREIEDYVLTLQAEIEKLPQRIPRNFLQNDLARMIYVAMPAIEPRHICTSSESIFEVVLQIVFEWLGVKADAHRMVCRTLKNHPIQWISKNSERTFRGGNKAKRTK